jgi:hypothetical protein
MGIDTHGPASVYLASDSRISWDGGAWWDAGRKLFASRLFPDLYGYCGDVEFPSLFLSQHVDLIDSGAQLVGSARASDRHAVLERNLRVSFEAFPAEQRRPFSVVHCARTGVGVRCSFSVWITEWSKNQGWETTEVKPPASSDTIIVLGSGEYAVKEQALAWRGSAAGGTSRAVFSAFCDSLRAARDPHSGGPPQLVGLYRKDAGISYGLFWEGNRYFLGGRVELQEPHTIEWRNELFERCNGQTGGRLPSAQPHLRPLFQQGI